MLEIGQYLPTLMVNSNRKLPNTNTNILIGLPLLPVTLLLVISLLVITISYITVLFS